jgi:hypothetical protein
LCSRIIGIEELREQPSQLDIHDDERLPGSQRNNSQPDDWLYIAHESPQLIDGSQPSASHSMSQFVVAGLGDPDINMITDREDQPSISSQIDMAGQHEEETIQTFLPKL